MKPDHSTEAHRSTAKRQVTSITACTKDTTQPNQSSRDHRRKEVDRLLGLIGRLQRGWEEDNVDGSECEMTQPMTWFGTSRTWRQHASIHSRLRLRLRISVGCCQIYLCCCRRELTSNMVGVDVSLVLVQYSNGRKVAM